MAVMSLNIDSPAERNPPIGSANGSLSSFNARDMHPELETNIGASRIKDYTSENCTRGFERTTLFNPELDFPTDFELTHATYRYRRHYLQLSEA